MVRIILLFSFLLTGVAECAEGFRPSSEKNVVMLKGPLSGATAFLLQTHSHGQVLVTQKHVLDRGTLTIQWGNAVGLLFRLKVMQPGAFQKAYEPEKIWEDASLDLTVLKLPHDLHDLCKCEGFLPGELGEGPARLVGYPITELRIFPRTNRIFSLWNQLAQEQRQQMSEGVVKRLGAAFVGDMDALPGDSGGPLLNQKGQAVGIVHAVLAKKEDGFRYTDPSIEILPIQAVIQALAGLKK